MALATHTSMRRHLAAILVGASMVAWGCTTDPEATGILPGKGDLKAATPKPTGITGGVGGDSSITASPTPTPEPTPTPTPTPTPSPAPTYQPFAIGVTVAIATDSLVVRPPSGATPLYPYTTTVTADVYMSNGAHNANVTWSTSDEAIASVSAGGLVTAQDQAGPVRIIATSVDGKASASVDLTVLSLGAAELIVD